MGIFPSCSYPHHGDGDIVYIDPLLAFNIGLHVSGFNYILQERETAMDAFFGSKNEISHRKTKILVELNPLSITPKYASHLRVSFVRIPECGHIESLRQISSIEAEERQRMIDSLLSNHFKEDRFLGKGDVFFVNLNWNCDSEICVACGSKEQQRSMIYFKV